MLPIPASGGGSALPNWARSRPGLCREPRRPCSTSTGCIGPERARPGAPRQDALGRRRRQSLRIRPATAEADLRAGRVERCADLRT